MSGFFCLYIAQFPAWVWEQSTPKVKGHAFVVVERGHVVSASSLALDAGIAVGMTSDRAQARSLSGVKGATSVPLLLIERDRRREELAWSEVQRAVYGLTPQVEPLETGTLFAQVESSKALTLLRGLNMRGGHAGDRATAHIAALSAPLGVARSITAGRERAFADGFPIETLHVAGLSTAAIARLAWFGWTKLGHLRALSRRQLEEQLGQEGVLLFRLAQGPLSSYNQRPVPAWMPPKEVVARIEFEVPVREPAEWDGALDELLVCACDGLGTQQAQTLEIEAGTAINPVVARRVLKEPLADPRALRRPTQSALHQALQTLAPLPPIVHSLTLRLGGLTSAPVQETLFPEQGPEREKSLEQAVEHLETRFTGRMGHYALIDPHTPFPEDAYGWLPALRRLHPTRPGKDAEVPAQKRRGGG